MKAPGWRDASLRNEGDGKRRELTTGKAVILCLTLWRYTIYRITIEQFFCRSRGALERCPKLRRTVWPADAGDVPRAAGAGRRRSSRLRDSQRSGVAHRRQSPAEHGNPVWNHQALAERWTDRGVAFTPRGFRRRTPPLLSIDAARPPSGGSGSGAHGRSAVDCAVAKLAEESAHGLTGFTGAGRTAFGNAHLQPTSNQVNTPNESRVNGRKRSRYPPSGLGGSTAPGLLNCMLLDRT